MQHQNVMIHVARSVGAARDGSTAMAADARALQNDIERLAGHRIGHDLDEAARRTVLDKVAELESLSCRGTLVDASGMPDSLAGTVWAPVFTTSTGTSSGKIGPFVAQVTQEFPGEAPGQYANVARLGPLTACLRGRLAPGDSRDTLQLEFTDLSLRLGPLQVVEKVRYLSPSSLSLSLSLCLSLSSLSVHKPKHAQTHTQTRHPPGKPPCNLKVGMHFCTCRVTFQQVFNPGQMRGFWRMTYVDEGFRVFYTNKGSLFVLRRLQT
jgi:hypothetical protein